MKILIIPSWYPIKSNPLYGSFVKEQAEALVERGHEVAVLYADVDYKQLQRRNFKSVTEGNLKVYRAEGFAFPKINFFFLNLWSEIYYKLYLQYKAEHSTPDLIHAHSFIGGYAAARLKEKTGIPLVLTEHNSSPYKETTSSRYQRIFTAAYNQADHVITVSNVLRDSITEITNTPVSTIYNFIDESMFRQNRTKPAVHEQAPFFILGIGDYVENKGFELLIEAVDIFRKNTGIDARLKLFGAGPEKEKYVTLIQRLALTGVDIGDLITRQQVATEMNSAHLFCLPSQYEPFGIVLIEALACGTPVIATGKGGPVEIINNENGILLQQRTPQAIATAIHQIHQQYPKFNTQKIITKTVDKYRKSEILHQIEEVYSQVKS